MIVSFDSILSKKIGVKEAIVMEYLQAFLTYRDMPLAIETVIDWGSKWDSPANIKRTLTSLKNEGYIIIKQHQGTKRVFITSRAPKAEQLSLIDVPVEAEENPVRLMNKAIRTVTKCNQELTPFTRYMRFAKKLDESGVTAEQIETWYGDGGWWYQHHWKGQKGNPPTQTDITDTIDFAKEHKIFENNYSQDEGGFWARAAS